MPTGPPTGTGCSLEKFGVRPVISIVSIDGTSGSDANVAASGRAHALAGKRMPLAGRAELVWQPRGAWPLLPWASPAQPQHTKLGAPDSRRRVTGTATMKPSAAAFVPERPRQSALDRTRSRSANR